MRNRTAQRSTKGDVHGQQPDGHCGVRCCRVCKPQKKLKRLALPPCDRQLRLSTVRWQLRVVSVEPNHAYTE